MRRRSMGGGLLGLFGLLFGLRVILALLGVAGVVIGAVFSGLAAAFSGVIHAFGSVLSGMFSGSAALGGVAMGIMIGLILYRMIRQKKEEQVTAAEKEAKTVVDAKESEFVEPRSTGSFYA